MTFISSLNAPHFIAIKTEDEIASRLREDEALINNQKPCSWIAWHLPGYDTEKVSAIAAHLRPERGLSHDIKRMVYENVTSRIRRQLKQYGSSNRTPDGTTQEMDVAEKALLPSELSTALKVIAHLQKTNIIQRDTTAEAITSWLEDRVAPVPEQTHSPPDASYIPKPPPLPRKRLCYICRLAITSP